jgi:2-dehydro-3-deoxyphosphogluconate aldolase/(4S)-4-hydroxy-2-oxoglutarate aldolase
LKSEVAKLLRATHLIGVIRCGARDQAKAIAADFLEGGLKLVELTLTTPGALDLIAELKPSAAAHGAVLGAGTVLTKDDAQAAVAAGAAFLVSPIADPDAIAVAHAAGVLTIAGAATPNEIVTAHRLGCDIVKVYPAPHLGGPAYIRTLRGPLPEIALLATGGTELRVEDIPGYAAAGAIGVGLGQGVLVDPAGPQATVRRIAAALETARLAWAGL